MESSGHRSAELIGRMAERRRGWIGLAITVLVLTFLHFALNPLFESWYAAPNLLLCAVLVAARQLRAGRAAVLGFVLGMLEDAMAVSHFGLATLLLVLIAYAGSRTRDFFVGEELLFMGVYLFLGTWLYESVSYAVVELGWGAAKFALMRAPLDALATSAVAYLILPLVRPR